MFDRHHHAFFLQAVDDVVRIDSPVRLKHRMHKARDLFRRDPGCLGFLLGGIGSSDPPEADDQERDACGNTRDSEAVHEASFEEEVEEMTGSVTRQDVPLPSTLSKRMSPPNFLMMRR